MQRLAVVLSILVIGACGGDSGNATIDAMGSSDGPLGSSDGPAAIGPPRAGDVGSTCTADMDCSNVPSGSGTCAAFGAAGLGCLDTCLTDDDCGAGNYCNDFELAGFPFLGKQCVHGCNGSAEHPRAHAKLMSTIASLRPITTLIRFICFLPLLVG